MIIQILSNLFEEGYLEKDKYTSLSPFFAGANVAFRKKALDQAGLYDEYCLSGEDQDMCLRIARAGWELYFEPKAKVRHKNKMTLRALLRKWYNHGFHHPYIFNKHCAKGLTVYRINKSGKGSELYKKIIAGRFPLNIHFFLTPFLTMHILLVVTIVLAILGFVIPALVFGLLTIVRALLYVKSDITTKNIPKGITFIFLRYAINAMLLLGGFIGGLKLGMIYISATFDSVNG